MLQQKQLFCIEFPSLQSRGLDVVCLSRKGCWAPCLQQIGLNPKLWWLSCCVVCACWTCGQTQHLRTTTPERICRIWKWTCWAWYVTCGVPCPLSLFPSPCAVWGLPALGCSSSSVLTAGLTADLSHLLLSLFYCRKPAKHCCLCPVEKLCGERAWGQHCSWTWDFTVPNSISS